MSTSGHESQGDCTAVAHAKRIPEWLRPYKDQWLTAGKIKSLIDAEGIYFGPWFEGVRSRLRSVAGPSPNGSVSTKYLVRHVWAAGLAHGLRLIPTDVSRPASEFLAEIDRLRIELALARASTTVRTEYVEVDRTGASMDIVRLLVAATEPQPQPGVYLLLDDDSSVVYVGQSKNVLMRMAGHGEKRYAAVRMIHVGDEKRRLEVESRLIDWLQPPLNLTGIAFRRTARPAAAA